MQIYIKKHQDCKKVNLVINIISFTCKFNKKRLLDGDM